MCAWDKTRPSGSTAIQDSDQLLRDNFAGIEEGLVPYDYIRLETQGSAPSAVADHGLVYAADVSSKAELHFRDEDGDAIQMTSGGNLGNANGYFDSNGDATFRNASVNAAMTVNADKSNEDAIINFGSFSDSTNHTFRWDDAGTKGWRIDDGNFFPGTDNAYDVGTSSLRWDDIYATNGTIQTSDQRMKQNVKNTTLGLEFVNKLRPVEYKWNGGSRAHQGFIAQELIQALGGKDFAGVVKGEVLDNEGNPKTIDYSDDSTYRLGLRYTELVAPLVKAVQELSKEVEELKAKLGK